MRFSRTEEQLWRNDKISTREEAEEWPLPAEWKSPRERLSAFNNQYCRRDMEKV
jgi:hypothetical protein